MMPQYGMAVADARSKFVTGGEIAQYLKWEYGEGTNLAFLKAMAAERRPPWRPRRSGLLDRFGGLAALIKARVASTPIDAWERELTLLAQWKRGEFGTPELVDRLEALERRSRTSDPV